LFSLRLSKVPAVRDEKPQGGNDHQTADSNSHSGEPVCFFSWTQELRFREGHANLCLLGVLSRALERKATEIQLVAAQEKIANPPGTFTRWVIR